MGRRSPGCELPNQVRGAWLLGCLAVAGPAAAQECSFDAELLRDLPASHDVWGLFETLEAVTTLDRVSAGGLYPGEAPRLGAHGASWTQATWRLGDLDVTDPVSGGVPLLLADPDWLECIAASTALTGAELSGSGPTIQLRLRRPEKSWRGSAAADVMPRGLQSSTPRQAPTLARYDSAASGRFRVDGPVGDRVGLLIAGAFERARRLERDDPRPVEGREASLLAQLVWTPAEARELRLLGTLQSARHPYAGRARFGGGDVSQGDHSQQLQATWERRGARPWSISAGMARAAAEPELPPPAHATVERLRDGPMTRLFPAAGRRSRVALGASAQPLGGETRHVLRVGASLSWSRADTRPAGDAGLTPEAVNGLPARAWDYDWAGPESRWRAFDLAAWATDRFSYGRLAADAGLRFELTDAAAHGAPEGVRWSAFAPRLAARFRLSSGLQLVGGWARYRHRLPLELLAYGDPAALQGRVYRWLDSDGDARFSTDELGPLVAAAGPGGPSSALAPGLSAPHSDELVAGLEAQFGSWTARFLGIHRRERNLVAPVDVGAPASSYTVYYVPDPSGDILGPADDQLLPIFDRRPESFGLDRSVLVNPPGDDALHEGVEIAVQRKWGSRLRLLLGGTAARSNGPAAHRGFQVEENDQGLAGERLEDPNALTHVRGRTFFDRAFTLKLAAAYHAPADLRLALVARYQDGQPFARLVIAPDLAQGPEAVRAIPNGRSRFTYTLTVDARLEKGVTLGRARIAALLDAFNLLDMHNEIEEDVVSGATFRAVSAVQPPRALRLGLRVDF
jgi:hypothetical protein